MLGDRVAPGVTDDMCPLSAHSVPRGILLGRVFARREQQAPHARMHRMLVTGGAGYIGSYVGAALVARGHQATVLEKLSRKFLDTEDTHG
jgi:hypothetical protein